MINPKITIIIPVYNVEKYLHRCLDSVKAQSYSNIEVLVINDGSKDQSGAICDYYEKMDSRFRVFHVPNGGVSNARNLGLDNAQGDWISFVDSDDFISPNYIENLLKPIFLNDKVEFVHGCGTYFERENVGNVIERFQDEISTDTIQLFNRFKGYVCGKLYKKDIIDKPVTGSPIRFNLKIRYSEDMLFTLEYILNVNTYAFSSEVGYFYNRDNEGSATHSIKWTYEDALYAFIIKYKHEMSFVKNTGITINDIEERIVLLAIALHQILTLLGQKKISISEKVKKLKTDIGVDKLFLLKYYQRGLVSRVVDKLFMLARLRVAFFFLPLVTFENRFICYIENLLRTH